MMAHGSGVASTGTEASARRDRAALAAVRGSIRNADPERWLLVRMAVPATDPLAVLGRALDGDAFHWVDRGDASLTTTGRAALVEARGDRRFGLVRERADALLAAVDPVDLEPGAGSPVPRVFGGLAFAAGAGDAEPWSGFGDARFVLPELVYERRGEDAWLSLCLPPHRRDEDALEAALARFGHALSAARAPRASVNGARPGPATGTGAAEGVEVGSGDGAREAYERRVRAALEAIAGGAFDKVVVARKARLSLARDVGIGELLARLSGAAGAYRFGVRAGDGLFLGATPERLVAVRNGTALTEALAGTAPLDGDHHEDPLDRRGKDLHEHEVVVRTIVDALRPFCSDIRHDPEPRIRTAGPVRHLATEIEGDLSGPAHVLALAERLHPTPAVGGSPAAPALAWLHEHEGMERGWYAAPVGWFDAHGCGELAVALRSGVLRGHDLDLYAGSGVVAGSDPAAEFDETRLKLRALPEALGVT